MRTKVYLLSLLYCFLLFACEGQNVTKNAPGHSQKSEVAVPKPAEKPNWESAKIYPNELVSGVAGNGYAFRLPANYSPEKKYTVLIFFDSHGRGIDPVKKYQSLGDQFDMILVGSNASKNGQQFFQAQQIFTELSADLKQKFSLADNRIWLAGFSGGARVAASIAQSDPQIGGVLACAAGFQARESDRFNYVGIVGMEDFNYLEMRRLDNILDKTNVRHGFVFFDGGHEWAPSENMKTGLEFLTLRAMAEKKLDRNDSLIDVVNTSFEKVALKNKRNGNLEWQRATLVMHQAAVEGLLSGASNEVDLASDVSLNNKFNEEEKQEMALRATYGPQIQTSSIDEWRKIAQELNAKANGKNQREAWLNKRILNFLSLNVYFQVTGNLQQNNLPAAEKFQQIYALVDPENAEHAYLLANIRARKGQSEAALQALETAEKLGFKDFERMQADPDFRAYVGTARFDELLARLKDKQ